MPTNHLNAVLRPRRLFVSGGSALSDQGAALWRELGRQLAAEEGLVVITGGLEALIESPGRVAADKALVDGFEDGLQTQNVDPVHRIETYLPDPKLDWSKLKRFAKGHVQVLNNRNAQSRRFRMVFAADVVTSIEGSRGTRSVLDVALAIERPVLPVPCGGGASGDVWSQERDEICDAFRLTTMRFIPWKTQSLGTLHLRKFRHWPKQCANA